MSNWLAFCDDDGHFALDDSKGFRAWVSRFKGQELVVSVKRRPRIAGTQQYRYLRGVVVPDIAKACGYSDPEDYEQVWEGLAWKFLRLPDGPFGEPRRRSTARDKMSLEELSKLIDQIVLYAETSIPDCKIRRPEEAELDDVIDPEWAA